MKKLSKRQISILMLSGAIMLGTAAGIVGYYVNQFKWGDGSIDSFAECAAVNPVMESYPEQCHANGRTFVNTELHLKQSQ